MELFCFGGMALIGTGFLIVSLIAGGLEEIFGDIFGFVDDFFENLGLDIFPDSGAGGDTSFGAVGIISAFSAGFGITGFILRLSGNSTGMSIIGGLISGVVIALIAFAVAKFFSSQTSNSMISENDMVGCKIRATNNSVTTGTANGIIVVGGSNYSKSFCRVDKKPIKRNETYTVKSVEGGILFVE